MVPGETPPVPRDKRTAVYAMAKVQKASRKYMRGNLSRNCLTNATQVPDGCVPGVNQRKLWLYGLGTTAWVSFE